jgi:acyl dehydratase
MKFFEDIRVGETSELGRHTFTAEDIKAFAGRFDPQPFHLDEQAAAQSHFGGLCASGWHTACVWMRLLIHHRRREDEERRARGEPVAELGPSPGFRDLKWLKPVYLGDTISYRTEVRRTRTLRHRPNWGMVVLHNTGVNQRGEPVISFNSSVLVERRSQERQSKSAGS